VGIIMSGWASNSKWSLLGGMRSAAQIVSYEIPHGLSVMVCVLLAGSLSTQEIIRSQGGYPWDWYIFHSPFTFVAAIIFFVAALAEGSRTPFDLPEAESELVSGYNTEYSGMRFTFFFLTEFANVWILAALVTVCFLGGWQIPGCSLEFVDSATGLDWWLVQALGFGIFFVKTICLVFVVIQLRWTLPRVRVDQMMNICWKYLVPTSFVCIIGVLIWMVIPWLRWESTGGLIVRILMTLLGTFIAGLYGWRIYYNIRASRDQIYLKFRV